MHAPGDAAAAGPASVLPPALSRALPARLFWVPALILDLLLVVLLPRSVVVAVGVVVIVLFTWMVRRAPVCLAVAAAGMPLLYPATVRSGDERVASAALILLVLLPGAVLVWRRLWGSCDVPAARPVFKDPLTWLVVAIGAWLVWALAWTPGPVYGTFKAKMYFAVNLVLFLGGALYLRPDRGDRAVPPAVLLFLRALLWIQVLIALTAVWNWFSEYYAFRDNRLRTLGMNPIWTARHAGLGIVVLLGLYALRRIRLALVVPLLALLAWVFLRSGSRGPLASLAVTLGYWAFTARRSRGNAGLTGAIWVGAALAAFAAVAVVQRSANLFAAGRQVSNLVRGRLLEVSVGALGELSLRGLGTGGFPSLFRLPDARFYPHNIFLEALLEGGAVGLALLAAFLLVTRNRWHGWGRSLRELPEGPGREEGIALRRTVGAIFIYALANAQFSGDIWVNEWVWVASGMIVACSPRESR